MANEVKVLLLVEIDDLLELDEEDCVFDTREVLVLDEEMLEVLVDLADAVVVFVLGNVFVRIADIEDDPVAVDVLEITPDLVNDGDPLDVFELF